MEERCRQERVVNVTAAILLKGKQNLGDELT